MDTYASLRPDRDYSAVLVRVADKESVQSVTNWINLYVRKVTAVRSEAALVDTASNIRSHRGITVGVLGVSWLVLMAALGPDLGPTGPIWAWAGRRRGWLAA